VERTTPVDNSVTFTDAFGTEAPEESVMLPVSVAVTTCAKEVGRSNRLPVNNARIRTTGLRDILTSSLDAGLRMRGKASLRYLHPQDQCWNFTAAQLPLQSLLPGRGPVFILALPLWRW
jgi:hypothetical protein